MKNTLIVVYTIGLLCLLGGGLIADLTQLTFTGLSLGAVGLMCLIFGEMLAAWFQP